MNLLEQEGVIKYQLDFQAREPCIYPQYAEVNAWRTILIRLGLIGQDPARYGGLGFGNVSFRLNQSPQFVITGSQTGGLKQLAKEHFSTIISADLNRNHIVAEGAIKPSSEALTHAAVYSASCTAKSVVHIHNADICRHYQALALPAIDSSIHYGTPAMAKAVSELFARNLLADKPVFIMLGHEDGIVSFGDSIAEACQTLILTLSFALTLSF